MASDITVSHTTPSSDPGQLSAEAWDGTAAHTVTVNSLDAADLDGAMPGTVTGIAGVLTVNVAQAGNTANTSEQDLWVYALPGGTLSADGRGLRITLWGSLGATGNSKTVKAYVGPSNLNSLGTTVNNGAWRITIDLFRTGASAEVYSLFGVAGQASNVNHVAGTLALDTSGSIAIKLTGQSPSAGAANDVVFRGALVERIN